MRLCNICGIPKKTTFRCGRCRTIVCLWCFNYVKNLCSDCEVLEYNEKYGSKIEDKYNKQDLKKMMEEHQIAG